MRTIKEKIEQLRKNLDENERKWNRGEITRQQYSARKRDAHKAINRLRGEK